MSADDLHEQLRSLGRSVPGRPGGAAAVRARVDRRRRTRLVAAVAAVVLVGTGVTAAVVTRDEPEPERVATAGPPTADGSTTTTARATTTTAPAGDRIVVDAAPEIVAYDAAGTRLVEFAPYADRTTTRASALGGTIVALSPAGDEITLLDADDPAATRPVTLDTPVGTDLWTLGVVDGTPSLVAADLGDDGDVLRAYSLDTGASTELARADGSSFGQPSVAADGTVYTVAMDADGGCAFVRIADGATTPTGLAGCELAEPTVTPDGTAAIDVVDDAVVRYDLATGAEIERWAVGATVELEGLQLDVADDRVLLGNSYRDDQHGPFVVVYLTDGTVEPLPEQGAPALLD